MIQQYACFYRFYAILCCCLFVFIGVSNVHAETAEEEFAIYQQYFTVMGTEAQYTQMLDIMLSQFQQGFAAGMGQSMEKSEKLTQEQQQQLQEVAQEAITRYLQRTRTMIEQVMPFDALVKDVYYPVYSKHFTVQEIQAMIAFFESPVGQKFVATTPMLMQEAVVIINQKYTPAIQQKSFELIEEELGKLEDTIRKMSQEE